MGAGDARDSCAAGHRVGHDAPGSRVIAFVSPCRDSRRMACRPRFRWPGLWSHCPPGRDDHRGLRRWHVVRLVLRGSQRLAAEKARLLAGRAGGRVLVVVGATERARELHGEVSFVNARAACTRSVKPTRPHPPSSSRTPADLLVEAVDRLRVAHARELLEKAVARHGALVLEARGMRRGLRVGWRARPVSWAESTRRRSRA